MGQVWTSKEHAIGQLVADYLKSWSSPTTQGITEKHLEFHPEFREEPFRLKIFDGNLFLQAPSLDLIGRYKKDFLATRRRQFVQTISAVMRRPEFAKVFSRMRTTISLCVGDGSMPPTHVALNPLTGVHGYAGGLAMPDDTNRNEDLSLEDVASWRNEHPWCGRSSKAVFRGNHGTCCPPAGNEMSVADGTIENTAVHAPLTAPCMRQEMVRQQNGCANGLADVSVGGGDRLLLRDQERYKLIVYAGGNYGWADRMKYLLSMGNAILRQHNHCGEEWYTHFLEPWVHYIPMDHLYRNMADMIAWAAAHDCEVQQISRNADAYARFFIQKDTASLYVAKLLQGYAKLAKTVVTRIDEGDIKLSAAVVDKVVVKSAELVAATHEKGREVLNSTAQELSLSDEVLLTITNVFSGHPPLYVHR